MSKVKKIAVYVKTNGKWVLKQVTFFDEKQHINPKILNDSYEINKRGLLNNGFG